MTPDPILTPPPEVEAIFDAATDSELAARFTETSVQLIAADGSVLKEALWPNAGQFGRNLQRNIADSVMNENEKESEQ